MLENSMNGGCNRNIQQQDLDTLNSTANPPAPASPHYTDNYFESFFAHLPEEAQDSDPLIEHCDDKKIISLLVRQKCKRVARRHTVLMRNIYKENTRAVSSPTSMRGWDRLLTYFLPARSEIVRPSKQTRQLMIAKAQSRGRVINSSDIYRAGLINTINSSKFMATEKYRRLRHFCKFIRQKIRLAAEFGTIPPKLQIRAKDASLKKFRVISIYSEIESLIFSLLADYLARIYDAVFTPCALAYRMNPDRKSDHNEAFRVVLKWTREHRDSQLYFFEYDFESFYDSIPHQTILREFSNLHREAQRRYPAAVHKSHMTIELLQSYLATYNFQNVLDQIFLAESSTFHKHAADLKEKFKGVPRCGIPQGTSLSCFLANVVLHRLDKKMYKLFDNGGKGLFVRYCDDSLTIGPDESKLQKAEKIFKETAAELGLKLHQPRYVPYWGENKRLYWNSKSKSTRPWGVPSSDGRPAPYLSFVGYQLHCSGKLFIRPGSIRKETVKQRRVVNEAIRGIKYLGRRRRISSLTSRLFFRSVLGRLCAMSVGFTQISAQFGRSEKCWVDAWTLLHEPHVELPLNQLKHLSRRRKWAISKLSWFVKNNRSLFSLRSQRPPEGSTTPTHHMLRGIYTYRLAMEHRRHAKELSGQNHSKEMPSQEDQTGSHPTSLLEGKN